MIGRVAAAMVLLSVLAGCGPSSNDTMPLTGDLLWSYRNKLAFRSPVVDIQAGEAIPVGDAWGRELVSTMGTLELAWSGPRLVATRLPGAVFVPPIPLLDTTRVAKGSPPVLWEGTVLHAGKAESVSARLAHEEDTLTVGGEERRAIRSSLEIRLADQAIVLDSWFQPGIGLIRQEHRANGELTQSLELVSGP